MFGWLKCLAGLALLMQDSLTSLAELERGKGASLLSLAEMVHPPTHVGDVADADDAHLSSRTWNAAYQSHSRTDQANTKHEPNITTCMNTCRPYSAWFLGSILAKSNQLTNHAL